MPITPSWVRHNPEKPFKFNIWLNLLFAFSSTFTVANLYYSQPILNQLAAAFKVGNERIGHIPTLSQAGYAVGILFITPLGDLVKRRTILLSIIFIGTCLTIGLAVTDSLEIFEALSFLIGIVTVTPQIMIPLVGDLAPPDRRASALSIVLSGLLLGILFARVIAGLIEYLSDYRVIYYFSIAVQALIFALLFIFLPDYPAKDAGLSYFGIIVSTVKMLKYPTLVQACLVGGLMSSAFINFWVTSTFLLGGAPYFYNALEIGLFGLLGITGVCVAPLAGKLIDRMVPWYSMILGQSITLVAHLVGFASQYSLGGVIPQVFLMDVGQSLSQISNQARIFQLEPAARSRINADYIIFLFLGQTMGSAVGTRLYTHHGWWASQGFAVGCIVLQMTISLMRGPWQKEDSWFGWSGGASIHKNRKPEHEEAVSDLTLEETTEKNESRQSTTG